MTSNKKTSLRIALPKGHMEDGVRRLLADAGVLWLARVEGLDAHARAVEMRG